MFGINGKTVENKKTQHDICWMCAFVRYLDHIVQIDISCEVPAEQRNKHNNLVYRRGICRYSHLHMSVKHEQEHVHDDHITSRLRQPQQCVGFLPTMCWLFATWSSWALSHGCVAANTHSTPVLKRRKAVGGPQAPRDKTNENDETQITTSHPWQQTVKRKKFCKACR